MRKGAEVGQAGWENTWDFVLHLGKQGNRLEWE